MKNIVSALLIIVSFAVVTGFVLAWTEPIATPPTCTTGNPGCDAPLNVSSNAQSKAGDLNIGGGLKYWITKLGDSFALKNNAGLIKFILGQDGNVGIGTAAPSTLLEIYKTNTSPVLTISAVAGDSTGDPYISFRTGAPTTRFVLGVDSSDSNKFKIATSIIGTNDVLTITQTGNVGIGTAAPNYKLEVAGNIYGSGGRADCGTPYMELASCRGLADIGAIYLEACDFRACNGCGCSGWNPGGTQMVRMAPGH